MGNMKIYSIPDSKGRKIRKIGNKSIRGKKIRMYHFLGRDSKKVSVRSDKPMKNLRRI